MKKLISSIAVCAMALIFASATIAQEPVAKKDTAKCCKQASSACCKKGENVKKESCCKDKSANCCKKEGMKKGQNKGVKARPMPRPNKPAPANAEPKK